MFYHVTYVIYTARAANWQPDQAGCGEVAHRKLAGVDDLYTARAANRQPAPAGYGGMAHRKLAGVDDLYTARAANLQPAPAGWRGAGVRDALADDLLKALAANRRLALLAVGGRCSSACAKVLLYAGRRLAAGSDWLRVVARSSRIQARQPHCPAPPTHPPTGEPITSPVRAAHTPAALDKTPPPWVEGRPAPSWRVGAWRNE